ncbi:aminopeptidase P family protein [archaeon]|jgi:Xaa-Pro aminopeptidase|nr:aminopeptidase P family protein [archaeon]MBT6822255.1 aminopeptidase P family protein [archaeon]MBT7392629.1 aminopeptidase P family protein [archaeon]
MNIKKLQKKLRENNIDFAIFYNPDESANSNVVYFSNYHGEGFLVVPKNKEPFLISNRRDYELALNTGIKTINRSKEKTIKNIINEEVSDYHIVGIDKPNLSVYLFEKIKKKIKGKYKDISTICKEIRKYKTDKEIKEIKKACQITDKIFEKIISNFSFKTENDIKLFIEFEIKKLGCELAFPPIAANEKNAAIPHYTGNSKIKSGFLLLDFGAKYNGYCSDMTRMLYIDKPKIEEISKYEKLRKIQQKTIENCSIRDSFSNISKKCRKLLGEDDEFFIHTLGHSLGMDIHEYPTVHTGAKEKIENNIIFTIEPGVYYKNKYGIRIEDTVVFIDDKLEILTKSKKDLVIIKKRKN